MEEVSKTIFGKKLENPYSVQNMQIAYANLKSDPNARTSGEELDIGTSHYYVRFLPASAEELERLQADSLVLWDVPLDYEIEEHGDYTPDPSGGGETEEWLYTSVEAGYSFPEGIRYEILEDLFLPEEYAGESSNARISTAFLEALEDEALRISGNLEAETEKEKAGPAQRGKEVPDGYVRVWDSERGALQPVVGVRVRTRRWFSYGEGYTNADGYYRVNEDYRRDVQYTVFFENNNGFKIWSTMIDVSPASHHLGQYGNGGTNIDMYQNSRAWRFATVNNEVMKYRDYCRQFSIGLPPSDLRIAATDNNDGGGAAPMLRRTWGLYGFNSNSQLLNYFVNANFAVVPNLIGSITKYVQPDIVVKAGSSLGTANVLETTFHELAHASHYTKVGSAYWVKYINYIITYGSYGEGDGNNAGLCALGEAWGYHMGYFLIIQEYGVNNSVFPLNSFENFDPRTRPEPDEVAAARYRNNSGWTGWIPGGIMHDITDGVNRDLVRAGFWDDVSGYNHSDLYDALDQDVDTPQEFRDRLLRENSNRDQTDLRNLFEAYFWN